VVRAVGQLQLLGGPPCYRLKAAGFLLHLPRDNPMWK
jgi:hypothetical protein